MAPFRCASDPDRETYQAFDLARVGMSELFTTRVFTRGFRAAMHGHFFGLPKGDMFQMPGIFLIDTDGIIRYTHRNLDASDNPSIEEIMQALDQLNSPRV